MISVAPRGLTECEQLAQEAAPLVRGAFHGKVADDREGVQMTVMPEIVSAEKWQQDRDELLKAEKEATRTLDAIAALLPHAVDVLHGGHHG